MRDVVGIVGRMVATVFYALSLAVCVGILAGLAAAYAVLTFGVVLG